jgi:peroxiredoxin
MSKGTFLKILATVVIVFLLGACAKSSAIEIGEKAPDFTLQNIDGTSASLSQFKGKVIILDFFASWCPPCRHEIPDFIALQNTYGNKGFAMIGISLVSPQESKDFAAKEGINYPILVDDGKVSSVYGPVRSIPTTFVLDKDMKIVKMYIGGQPKEVFENDIKELLK